MLSDSSSRAVSWFDAVFIESVEEKSRTLTVKGPKGALSLGLRPEIDRHSAANALPALAGDDDVDLYGTVSRMFLQQAPQGRHAVPRRLA